MPRKAEGAVEQEETLEMAKVRVDKAFAEAGLTSWESGVAECRRGTLLRLEFAERRPGQFVKAFSAMVRADGLKMGADVTLNLYLGTPAALDRVSGPLPVENVRDVVGIGAIEESETGAVKVSGARRSAGIKYLRRAKAKRLDGLSVLVLDDDAFSREVLRAGLERDGCSVQTAGEAEAAFSLLRKAPVDALVLDVVLGGTMTGFDFSRVIRSNAQYASIPVIFVTGYVLEHPKLKAEGIEASAWFGKPVNANDLSDAVLTLVTEHRGGAGGSGGEKKVGAQAAR